MPQLVILAKPTTANPIVELPRDLTQLDIVNLDRKFYAEEHVQQNTTHWVCRICTWEPSQGSQSLRCAGYPGSSENR